MAKLNKKHVNRSILKNNSLKSKEELYLKYITALIKTEDLQNKLEKTYSSMLEFPSTTSYKKTEGLNNNLNNLMVKVMIMQNLINYMDANIA